MGKNKHSFKLSQKQLERIQEAEYRSKMPETRSKKTKARSKGKHQKPEVRRQKSKLIHAKLEATKQTPKEDRKNNQQVN